MTAADRLLHRLRREIDASTWGSGYQISVVHRGEEIVADAYGTGGLLLPMTVDSLVPIYCAGKPIAASVIAVLAAKGELSYDDVLADVIDRELHPTLRRLTLADVLAHTAGLGHHPPQDYLTMPPAEREAAVLGADSTGPADVPFYSQYVGWELLRYAVEDLCDLPFEEVARRYLLEPLGLADDVRYTIGEGDGAIKRLRTNVYLEQGVVAPLVWERHPSNLADLRVATGALASMSALASFYTALLAMRSGAGGLLSSEAACELTAPRSSPGFDRALGRECSFSLGFMVDLAAHGYAPAHTAESFGHSGVHGMTFAGAEPTLDLAYAVHVNGVTPHDTPGDIDRSPHARRSWISNTILSLADR